MKKCFYKNYGEDDCNVDDNRGQIDPVLKLYKDCPLMIVNNVAVENGQANGTRVRLLSVTLQPGEELFELKLESGTRVRTLFASQVMSLTVKQEADDIVPQVFDVASEKVLFKATLKIGSEQYITGNAGNAISLNAISLC